MFRALALVLLLFCGAARAQPVSFPSAAVGNVAAGPEITARIYKPEGPGPFAAVILAHSCAGVNAHTEAWANRIVSWGYLVLTPDSFGPRGEKQVCAQPGLIVPNRRVADIAGALDFLATRPDVIPGKVGLIGHSHGGSTTIRSIQQPFDLARRGLRGGVAYYPGCFPQFDRGVALPLLILIGDKDDWTPAEGCRRLQAVGLARPELVEAVYYPNALHSFDARARERTVQGAPGKVHRLAYDAEAAPDAEVRTKAFFEKILR